MTCGRELRVEGKRRWFLLDFCRYAGALGKITNPDGKYTSTEVRTFKVPSKY